MGISDSFIIFTYRVYLWILDKYDNSPLLKQVRIVLLTIVFLGGNFSNHQQFFLKKGIETSNIINYAKLIINTLLSWFWNASSFVYFFYYYCVK